MHRRHETLHDAAMFMQDAGNGRQTVGGAGRVRNHRHIVGQAVVIDTIDDRGVGPLRRCRNNDLCCAGVKMGARRRRIGENAGTFHDKINAMIPPAACLGAAFAKIGNP
ncbi:MAG: Uncharacterised protein [SAR116 cluster bacterium]|nr:MAG: Uncharacterised protein [SAR116 cluster bacterium]